MTNTESIILETDHWQVILRTDDQTYLGRAVVVCKRVVPALPELTAAEWADLKKVMTIYETACKKAFGATMFNWTCLMNDAYQHQPPDPAVHWHVRPRYKQSVELAGQKFEDTKFGHHYERKTNRTVSNEVAKEMMERLKRYLP